MLEAVAYLHGCNVAHRDVKADNFLLDRDVLSDPNCRLVLADFGHATRFSEGERWSGRSGTDFYWSPEVYDKNYGPKVDVWSIGVIMCLMLDGCFPFGDEAEARHSDVELPTEVPADCVDLVLGL